MPLRISYDTRKVIFCLENKAEASLKSTNTLRLVPLFVHFRYG